MITCEHAGNDVPTEYGHVFTGSEQVLSSHRAWDPGALEFAQRVAGILAVPVFSCTITRLLIDTNRSPGHRALFSEFSSVLSNREKEWLIHTIYHPYRDPIERLISEKIRSGNIVLHLSIHSFTPVLHGKTRNADVGLLYDPGRRGEKDLSKFLQRELHRNTGLRIRRNYPYRGHSDGFVTTLRGTLGAKNYLGLEIELNQVLLDTDGGMSSVLVEKFCRALGR